MCNLHNTNKEQFIFSTAGKSFNIMSKVNQETVKKSRTNLKEDIDIAIVNEIDKNEPLAPSDLKRNIV
jgi:hypothetical protein